MKQGEGGVETTSQGTSLFWSLGLGTGIVDTGYLWMQGEPYEAGKGNAEITSPKKIFVLVAGSGFPWCDVMVPYKIREGDTENTPGSIWGSVGGGSLALRFMLWKRRG